MVFSVPVFAASSFFTKSTTKLNAVNGGNSVTSSVTSGSVLGSNPTITQVRLALNVSSGTDPYTLYVKSPNSNSWKSYTGSTSSTIWYLDDFDGENPYGTWKFYIKNNGVSYNGNLIPVSTVGIKATVYYNY